MLRTSLVALSLLLLTACGIDPVVPAVLEAPLVAAPPVRPAPPSRLGLQELAARPHESGLRPVAHTVSVHSLAVPDGTPLRYLLGLMGCGISVVARGAATVQGGAFEIPYDPASGSGQVSLYFQVGQTCDPDTSQVFEVPVTLPGTVDLSVFPEQSFVGCWLFDDQP